MTVQARSSLIPLLVAFAGIAVFSLMDALMKRAAIATGVYTALLLRCAIGAAGMAPVWLARKGRWPRRPVLRLHVWRAVLVAGMATSFFWGLVRTPMAEGMALSFISPLIALALAALFLGERIRRSAILASLMGLAGVAIIAATRLSAGSPSPDRALGLAAILLSAVFYAGNLVLQRRQAQVASPVEVALFQNAIVALVLLPALPWLWQLPGRAALIDIALAALLASAALVLLSWAYARAEAQELLPVEYTAFGWAALMGWLWFDEPVHEATLIGVCLIVAGCLVATRSSRRSPPDSA
ncbi:DMT family transporter [Novosphingobium flavum]|nr:DMT family transporter [Novosphingobium flavum]